MHFKRYLRKNIYYVNKALSGIDRFFYVKNKSLPIGPVFIVGVPRSGTTLTYQAVTQYFRFSYFPDFFNYCYGIPTIMYRVFERFFVPRKGDFASNFGTMRGFFTPGELGTFLRRWFPEYGYRPEQEFDASVDVSHYQDLIDIINSCQLISKKPLVIKTVYLNFYLDVIVKIFPNAVFIHVERDVLDICQSFYNKRSQLEMAEQQWWSVRPPHYKELMNLPLWKQCVEHVYAVDKGIHDGLWQIDQKRVFNLTYRSLCAAPQEICKQLEQWLGTGYVEVQSSHKIPKQFRLKSQKSTPDEIYTKMKDFLVEKGY